MGWIVPSPEFVTALILGFVVGFATAIVFLGAKVAAIRAAMDAAKRDELAQDHQRRRDSSGS